MAVSVEIKRTPRQEGRLRIVLIPRSWLLEVLRAGVDRRISLPVESDVPSDSEIVEVHNHWERSALAVKVAHESFEPVPAGQMIPEVDRLVMFDTFKIVPAE